MIANDVFLRLVPNDGGIDRLLGVPIDWGYTIAALTYGSIDRLTTMFQEGMEKVKIPEHTLSQDGGVLVKN